MYISLGSIIGILGIVNIGTWLTLTEHTQFNMIYSAVIAVLSVAFVYFNRARFQHFYQSVWFKHFSSFLITISLVSIILGFANYLAFKNVKNFDFSGRHIHSLPPEMEETLEKIPGDLRFTVISPKYSINAFRTYLSQLRSVKKNIQFDFFQPHLRPDLLKEYRIEAEQSVIVHYEDRTIVLTSFTHVDFAKAFKRLINASRVRLGYTINHNEQSWKSSEKNGFKNLADFLEAADVDLIPVDLRSGKYNDQKKSLDVLFVLGPQVDFSQDETESLDQFIDSGKSVILSIDPSIQTDNVPNLREWTKKYGVIIKNSYVIDKYSFVNGSNGTVPLVQKQWGGKEFFKLKFPLFFPLASHIEAVLTEDENPIASEIEPILVTTESPHSWAEMNHEEVIQQKYLYNKNDDVKGPVTLSAMVSVKNKGKILLLGNSRFLENNYQKFQNNFDFVLKGIEHIGLPDTDLKLSMPMVKEEPLFINGIQVKLVFYLTIFVMPLLGCLGAYLSYRVRLS